MCIFAMTLQTGLFSQEWVREQSKKYQIKANFGLTNFICSFVLLGTPLFRIICYDYDI